MLGQFNATDAYPSQLLDDYLAVSRRRHPSALYATALRTRSISARHLLARAVSTRMSLEDLVRAAVRNDTVAADTNPQALSDLAGVIALQNVHSTDVSDGVALYELALRLGGVAAIPPRHQGIHAQLLFGQGDRDGVARLLRLYRTMPRFIRATLELDLANPFGSGADPADWLAAFNQFSPAGVIQLADGEAAPLDRIHATVDKVESPDHMVSVVVSAYHPDQGLLTSVRSVLAQSWSNLEVLVVDDGSPSQYDPILAECAQLDPRVRVIRQPRNGGTYTARNTAMDLAGGEFITFHDSDDWAHPLRLQRQVTPMLQRPQLMATISQALTVTDQLVITKPGRSMKLLCTPSLMFRKAAVTRRLGYFDSIRKAADTEYLRRIQAAFGSAAVLRLDEVYTLMRQGADSLSRAEFRAGWKHPARDAYQSAYQPWHAEIRAGKTNAYLERDPVVRRFAVPRRFAKLQTDPGRYDVVLACDWRPFGGPQKSMLEEIAALTGDGLKVAVLHLESYRHMTQEQRPLCAPIQKLINAGVVDQVLPTDEVEASLLVLRYPPILQFRASETVSVRPKRMIILANQAPSELDGTDLRYVPAVCTRIAKELFGVDPLWYPQGPAARAALQPHLTGAELAEDDMPGIIAESESALSRKGFRSELPVLGRHSRDDWTKWPADARTLLSLYPDSPDIDVRIMGGAKAAKALLAVDELPANWIVYNRGDLDVRNFLHQLDFYVYFPHPNMIEAFGRAILEALAAGCVTVLPPHFEAVFGDAALYCEPQGVPRLIQTYRDDRERFLAQSHLAQERVRQRFSHKSYLALIRPFLSVQAAPEPPVGSVVQA